ncbi:ganglioside GM2 activator-like isoform X2 [Dreissena polymorpha]|uniref:ganglioside GM2 activator-like isoform X2 n=1 Tax=Dreissena polymorpha TaxID=45954 RepID=UPI002263AE7D|nr:ganglioside GM2 activator-like isoform X2 [Dreissena polymorpha]
MATFLWFKACFSILVLKCVDMQNSLAQVRKSSFENCNKTEAVLVGNNLTFSPNPLVLHPDIDYNIGPTITFYGRMTVLRKMPSHDNERIEFLNSFVLSADNTTTELCQILPLDFCHVADVCKILSDRFSHIPFCPILFHNGTTPTPWNCLCPFQPGTYIMPNLQYTANDFIIPFRLRADFKVIVKIKENGVPVGCFSFELLVRKRVEDFNGT